MNCGRCQGLMLEEHLMDLESSYGGIWVRASRCINCGHRDEPVMQQHRRAQAEPRMAPLETVATQEERVVPCEPDAVEPLAA